MPSTIRSRRVLAALVVAAALLGAAGPADGGTQDAAADRALNTSTATPTATPYCTGPGCPGTPTETYIERPACETNPDTACTASPTEVGDWGTLLRPLAAVMAPMVLGLLAVGAVLARWRLGPD